MFDAIDTAHVGIAGHSLGAAAVSYIGQLDPRVKAIVAYDNLNDVTQAGNGSACASGSSERPETLPVTKPVLGLSADYGLVPQPNTADPDPLGKSEGSLSASKAGVDTGELIIRGGTHYEFSYIPNPAFGGTRRGMDMVAWYTVAWMDKQLKGDATADERLLTTRWQDDRLEKEVDHQTPPDGNLFSTYFKSRLDFAHKGGRFTCEDVRKGCTGMAADSLPADYSFVTATQVKDTQPSGSTAPAGSTGTPPAATGPAALTPPPTTTPACRPRSRITRITRKGRRYTFHGTASTCAKQVKLVIRRGKRTRRVAVTGTRRWRTTVRLKRARYRIQAHAKGERTKRGHRVRVR